MHFYLHSYIIYLYVKLRVALYDDKIPILMLFCVYLSLLRFRLRRNQADNLIILLLWLDITKFLRDNEAYICTPKESR